MARSQGTTLEAALIPRITPYLHTLHSLDVQSLITRHHGRSYVELTDRDRPLFRGTLPDGTPDAGEVSECMQIWDRSVHVRDQCRGLQLVASADKRGADFQAVSQPMHDCMLMLFLQDRCSWPARDLEGFHRCSRMINDRSFHQCNDGFCADRRSAL